MAELSGEQNAFYCEERYLTVPDALDLGTVERLCTIVDEWIAATSDVK